MTIANTNVSTSYNANGVTREWNLGFHYDSTLSSFTILVTHADGTSTTVTTNYELDGNVLTYPTVESELDPLPLGDVITITRVTPLTQAINLVQQGPLDAETLESGYDKGVLISQELKEGLDRAIKFPPNSTESTDAQEYIDTLTALVDTATTQAGIATTKAGEAATSATSADTAKTNAQKWAEGTDTQVEELGGTHSSKGWADVSKQYAESIGAALKYKGSVATYSALPSTGQEVGDMWNVLDTGKNYAWTGTEWDDLAGVVDLSAYRTAANQDIIDGNLSTTITNHTGNTSNPHSVTKEQVGLGNVDNTSDLNKPVSTATQTALSGKQDTLVSGTNIKTVNNNSLLGSGNVDIDALPSQTGQSGKFLTTNGTSASWAAVDALPSQTGQSGRFLTTDGSIASWASVQSFGGKNIGEVYFSESSSAQDNPGGLPLFTGETIANADQVYPDFYDWVLNHSALQVSAEDYNTAITTYGECPYYVIDTVNKTIRLPLLKNYIKNANTVDGITQAEAGLPNITGTWDAYKVGNAGGGSATGALKMSGGTQRGSAANESANNTKLELDASESNDIYGNSTTVTPAHTTLFPWVCAYNAAVEASVAQAAEFQQALTGKLDTDLDNIANAGKDAIVNMCMPDYANVVTVGPINAGTYTQVAKDSFVIVRANDPFMADNYLYVSPDNGTTKYTVGWWYNDINSATKGSSWSFFVPKGWYFTSEVENPYTAYIYPLKGAQ